MNKELQDYIKFQKSLVDVALVEIEGKKYVSYDSVCNVLDSVESKALEFLNNNSSKSSSLDSWDSMFDGESIELPFDTVDNDSTEDDIVKVQAVSSSSGKWVGNLGDTVVLDLEFTYCDGPREGNFGTYNVYHFEYMGNKVSWLTSVNKSLIKGNIYKIMCTIKEHVEYNGERITRLKNCRFQ